MPDTAVDAFPDPVVSTDDHGIVVRCNPVAAALLHVSADAALGRPVDDLLQLTARDDSGRYPARRWVTAGQITVPVELTAWQSSADGVIEHHLCLRDATQRVADEAELARAEALLRRQAPFDALTGLANRYELEERLTAALAHSRDGQIACVVVGLDGANTSAGHSPGPSPRPPATAHRRERRHRDQSKRQRRRRSAAARGHGDVQDEVGQKSHAHEGT